MSASLGCGGRALPSPGAPLPEPIAIVAVGLTAGTDHTCEIRSDGTLWCWGVNSVGQLGNGTREARTRPTRVGRAADWQAVSAGESMPYANPDAAAGAATCGIRANGALYCWGNNFAGQLGNGTFESAALPAAVATDRVFRAVSVGVYQTCAVDTTGALYCWGGAAFVPQTYGEVRGVGPTVPTRVGIDGDWADVALGSAGSCGLRRDGTVWCWAGMPDGSRDPDLVPIPVRVGTDTDWTRIDVGVQACGLRGGGSIFCWGMGGPPTSWTAPQQVGTAADWREISVGGQPYVFHACARNAAGELACWGWNDFGQLGIGSPAEARLIPDPTPLAGQAGWTSVRAGGIHTCGRRDDGTLHCWGSNSEGRLGIGVAAEKVAPMQADAETDWLAVDPLCGIRQSGDLYCWGRPNASPAPVRGGEGQWLTFEQNCGIWYGNRLACRDVAGGPYPFDGSSWVEVSGNHEFACARRDDLTLHCWGKNRVGEQLGRGTVARPAPIPVAGGRTWASVSMSSYVGCAITTDRMLFCWPRPGLDDQGALRDAPQPVQVGTDADWESVSATTGYDLSCGLRAGGQLYCWSLQSPTPLSLPGQRWQKVRVRTGGGCGITQSGALSCWTATGPAVAVAAGTDWIDVRVSWDHACALRSNGTRFCWGANADGQLGDGSAWRVTPVPVTP